MRDFRLLVALLCIFTVIHPCFLSIFGVTDKILFKCWPILHQEWIWKVIHWKHGYLENGCQILLDFMWNEKPLEIPVNFGLTAACLSKRMTPRVSLGTHICIGAYGNNVEMHSFCFAKYWVMIFTKRHKGLIDIDWITWNDFIAQSPNLSLALIMLDATAILWGDHLLNPFPYYVLRRAIWDVDQSYGQSQKKIESGPPALVNPLCVAFRDTLTFLSKVVSLPRFDCKTSYLPYYKWLSIIPVVEFQIKQLLYLLENKLLSKNKLPWKISAYGPCNHFDLKNKRLFKSLAKCCKFW